MGGKWQVIVQKSFIAFDGNVSVHNLNFKYILHTGPKCTRSASRAPPVPRGRPAQRGIPASAPGNRKDPSPSALRSGTDGTAILELNRRKFCIFRRLRESRRLISACKFTQPAVLNWNLGIRVCDLTCTARVPATLTAYFSRFLRMIFSSLFPIL